MLQGICKEAALPEVEAHIDVTEYGSAVLVECTQGLTCEQLRHRDCCGPEERTAADSRRRRDTGHGGKKTRRQERRRQVSTVSTAKVSESSNDNSQRSKASAVNVESGANGGEIAGRHRNRT